MLVDRAALLRQIAMARREVCRFRRLYPESAQWATLTWPELPREKRSNRQEATNGN